MDVTVLLSNCYRPANLPMLLAGFRKQTVPVKVILVDAGKGESVAHKVDQYVRVEKNYGSINRLLVRMADTKYLYVHDDDMYPGTHCIEWFLENTAKQEFGILGQQGRILDSLDEYNLKQVGLTNEATEVDFVIRGYFLETRNLALFDDLCWRLIQGGMSWFDFGCEDFILLSAAMKMAGKRNYLLPSHPDRQHKMNANELESRHSLWTRPDANERKTRVIQTIHKLGWTPLFQERDNGN